MNFGAAILYAVSSSTLLALILAFAGGGLTTAAAAGALVFGLLIAASYFWSGRHAQAASTSPSAWEWAAIAAFALVSMRVFLWVVFVEDDEIKVLSPNNLGDLSLHLTYVRYLASGVPFWPENPIFAGAALSYPVGVDFFHSLLVLVGIGLDGGRQAEDRPHRVAKDVVELSGGLALLGALAAASGRRVG